MAVNMCPLNCSEDATGFLLQMISSDFSWDQLSHYQLFVYNPWLFSLLGSTMVGLAGILPLLVIPIDEGADLKNGANAGMLKMLLSFAVGGLLGDVFLHVLPEAWENDSLKKVENNGTLRIPCGLWVLNGFLVFLILEKIFSVTSSELESTVNLASDKDTENENSSTNSEMKKMMENNNCITLVSAKEKNGFIESCKVVGESLMNNEIRSFLEKKGTKNGYVEMTTTNNVTEMGKKNGFVKSLTAYKEQPLNGLIVKGNNNNDRSVSIDESKTSLLLRLSKSNGFSKELSLLDDNNKIAVIDSSNSNNTKHTEDKGRQIAGYLNLMANCFDNFSHGLSVGASFMMSFRLGAFTTFAILMHEIPHEVGDFAILLRSGFSRWDAARAQLLTASGGIFGSITAVFFAGGGIKARTNWILPFTAGNFLHIGLVTILPELIKESSPKESLKQLGALLFGISLMALLSIFGE